MFNCDIIHEAGAGYRAIVSYTDFPDVEIGTCPGWKTCIVSAQERRNGWNRWTF